MKWATLLNDLKEEVGLTQTPSSPSSPSLPASSSASTSSTSASPSLRNNAASADQSFRHSLARDKHELELDFKRFWDEFRSSSSEKEKEAALNSSIDSFCRLVQQETNLAQLFSVLVETHIFSFVVGRAFVTDIEKLKIGSKTRSLDVNKLIKYFSEETKDEIYPGSNLLTALEVLVSGVKHLYDCTELKEESKFPFNYLENLPAAGILLAVWSINGDCLAVVSTSQLPSDSIVSVTSSALSDWRDTNWYVTGHQSGAIKVWHMVHCFEKEIYSSKSSNSGVGLLKLGTRVPEYILVLHKVLKSHKSPVAALHLTNDLKQLLSGDSNGHLLSWTITDESLKVSLNRG